MRGDVLDALAADPDFALLLPQSVQVLASRASRHGASPVAAITLPRRQGRLPVGTEPGEPVRDTLNVGQDLAP